MLQFTGNIFHEIIAKIMKIITFQKYLSNLLITN